MLLLKQQSYSSSCRALLGGFGGRFQKRLSLLPLRFDVVCYLNPVAVPALLFAEVLYSQISNHHDERPDDARPDLKLVSNRHKRPVWRGPYTSLYPTFLGVIFVIESCLVAGSHCSDRFLNSRDRAFWQVKKQRTKRLNHRKIVGICGIEAQPINRVLLAFHQSVNGIRSVLRDSNKLLNYCSGGFLPQFAGLYRPTLALREKLIPSDRERKQCDRARPPVSSVAALPACPTDVAILKKESQNSRGEHQRDKSNPRCLFKAHKCLEAGSEVCSPHRDFPGFRLIWSSVPKSALFAWGSE